MRNIYIKGTHNVICDICGFAFKSGDLVKNWKGEYVCSDDYEPRHPLDFIRSQAREQIPAFTRPEATDTFVSVTYLTPDESTVSHR